MAKSRCFVRWAKLISTKSLCFRMGGNVINYSKWSWRKVFFCPTQECFTHMETLSMPVKDLQIFTHFWHSWPLSSESSLVCQTYCETGHPVILSSRGSVTLTPIAKRLAVELSLSVFTSWVCCCLDFRHPPFPSCERSDPLRHRCGSMVVREIFWNFRENRIMRQKWNIFKEFIWLIILMKLLK